MQIIFVPSSRLEGFVASGEVTPRDLTVEVDRATYLRPVDFPSYMSGLLRERAIDHGGIGRVFVWWRDDFEDGECGMEETLVPVTEWTEGGWIHKLDAVVVEVLEPAAPGVNF